MFQRSFLCFVILSILILAGCIIKGKIVDGNGAGVSGVTVTLSGDSSLTTATDSDGKYQFGNFNNMLSSGSYTVTPSKSGHSFTPTSRSFTMTTTTIEDFGDVPLFIQNIDFTSKNDSSIIFFDDFDDGTYINKWSILEDDGTASITESGSELHISVAKPTASECDRVYLQTIQTFSAAEILVEAKIKHNGWGGAGIWLYKDSDNYILYRLSTDDTQCIQLFKIETL